jgi:uncharacterized protein
MGTTGIAKSSVVSGSGMGRGVRVGLVAAALAVAVGACAPGSDRSEGATVASEAPVVTVGVAKPSTTVSQPSSSVAPASDSTRLLVNRNSQNPNPMVSANNWADMADFMAFVIHDADSFWTPVLVKEGRSEPQVKFRLPAPGEVVKTGCKTSTSDTSMFYCPGDDTIYFSQALATSLWKGTYVGPDRQKAPGGDMAPALMLAHEFAHSIQDEVGLTTAKFGVPRIEKHADCWAGVWARNAAGRGVLDQGDLQEALNTAFVVGDSQVTHAQHHGTPAQRVAAFRTGFGASTPKACDSFLTK